MTADVIASRDAGGPHSAAPPAWLLIALVALTAARLLAAATIPLTEDEAYYRLWAGTLQAGYYDHPPMIAWMIRAGMAICGDDPLGVRLFPTLACGLTGFLVFDLARELGAARRTAARASLWFNATLLVAAGGTLATPDAAVTPFWVLTLCCLARTMRRNGAAWWLAAGAAAGLACLSKYSALFVAPGALVWLALRPGGLSGLRKPWPWAAVVIAAAIFGVNVLWNAQHHWATFDKQFGRVAPHGFKPGYLAELIIGQALLLNPLVTAFLARAVRRPWRTPTAASPLDPSLLWGSCLPFAAYLVVHSLHDRVQAHWPVPIYPALAILAAAAAADLRPQSFLAGLRTWTAPVGIGLGGLALVHLALPATDLKHVKDPTLAVRGWPTFTAAVDAQRAKAGAAWIGALSYGTTAQLDANGADAPVVQIDERDRYPASDSSWRADLTRPGLVLDLDRRANAATLGACFAQVTPLGELARGEGRGRRQAYAMFEVSQPRRDVLTQGCFDRGHVP